MMNSKIRKYASSPSEMVSQSMSVREIKGAYIIQYREPSNTGLKGIWRVFQWVASGEPDLVLRTDFQGSAARSRRGIRVSGQRLTF